MTLSGSELALLRTFVRLRDRDPSPHVPVTTLSKSLGIAQPTVSRRIQGLLQQGWVRRRSDSSGTQIQQYYEPSPGLVVQWVAPDKGVVLEWSSLDDVDWRFPLVSQVPDADARETIKEYLARLSREGLLSGSGDHRSKRGPVVIAYGSTVRADARPDADVDLLVAVDDAWPSRSSTRIDDLAADASLTTPRPLHLAVTTLSGFDGLPGSVLNGIEREGLIVYDGWGTSHGLWSAVYGKKQIP